MEEHETRNEQNIEQQIEKGGDQQYEFVTETIKTKPINVRRLVMKAVYTVLMAALFGVVASLVFVFLEPEISKRIHPVDDTKTVTIPGDEAYNEEDTDNTETVETEIRQTKENSGISENTTGEIEEVVLDDESEENAEAEEDADPSEEDKKDGEFVISQVVEKELELSDYKLLYEKMGKVAGEAKRYLVTVTGIFSGTDWFMNQYENNDQTSGMIIADNGKELLILSATDVLKNAENIEVTFCNSKTYAGHIKKSDINTGLAIIAVNLSDIDDNTKNSIMMAKLGNSKIPTIVGSPVIAVGSPLGIKNSMAIGQITSNTYVKDMLDTNTKFLTTDIYGSISASGVIIDMEGKVLGFIFRDETAASDTGNLIKAYGISDLKARIEKLSNGQDLAYLGVKGTDVTEDAAEKLLVPMGAYITQVIVDSPAMNAGIQNGDVIVKFGTSDIASFDDFKGAMLKSQPGDLTTITIKRLGKDGYVEFPYEVELGTLE